LHTSNNRARAVPFIEELLTERPGDSTLQRALAQAYHQAGRIEEAVSQLDTLAESLLQAGKKEETMVIINQILLMNPSNAEQYRQLLQQLQQGR
jgi:predicted Zn-dependent protease